MRAEPFVHGLKFGEGLRWQGGRFWYSDFYNHRISSAAPDGSVRVEVECDDQPSGLGWLPDGSMLIVSMTSNARLNFKQVCLTVGMDHSITKPVDLNELSLQLKAYSLLAGNCRICGQK